MIFGTLSFPTHAGSGNYTVDGDAAVADVDAGAVVRADGEHGLVVGLAADESLAARQHRPRVHHLHRER